MMQGGSASMRVDDGAQMEQLQAAGLAERVDELGVGALHVHRRCLPGVPRRRTRAAGLRPLFSDGLALRQQLNAADVPGQQLVDAVDAVLGDALEHGAQVGLRVQPVELRGPCRPPNYAERPRFPSDLRSLRVIGSA